MSETYIVFTATESEVSISQYTKAEFLPLTQPGQPFAPANQVATPASGVTTQLLAGQFVAQVWANGTPVDAELKSVPPQTEIEN